MNWLRASGYNHGWGKSYTYKALSSLKSNYNGEPWRYLLHFSGSIFVCVLKEMLIRFSFDGEGRIANMRDIITTNNNDRH